MKRYWSILGPEAAPTNAPCHAFYKYDGSNIRFEYERKKGWHAGGTRRRLINKEDPLFGSAFDLFLSSNLPAQVEEVLANKYSKYPAAIIYCEFFGPNSFADYHDPNDQKKLVLIDVCIEKRGIILPAEFVENFGHIENCAELIYEGPFNDEFVQSIVKNKYSLKEGIVAKGIKPETLLKGKNPQHGLWMAKVKTLWWLNELKVRASQSTQFDELLQETMKQSYLQQAK